MPPLPDPEETLGPNFSRYGWRYDQSSQSRSYTFTDLDTVIQCSSQQLACTQGKS